MQNLKSNGYPWGKFYKHEIIKSNHLRFNEHLQINEDHLFVFNIFFVVKQYTLLLQKITIIQYLEETI